MNVINVITQFCTNIGACINNAYHFILKLVYWLRMPFGGDEMIVPHPGSGTAWHWWFEDISLTPNVEQRKHDTDEQNMFASIQITIFSRLILIY